MTSRRVRIVWPKLSMLGVRAIVSTLGVLIFVFFASTVKGREVDLAAERLVVTGERALLTQRFAIARGVYEDGLRVSSTSAYWTARFTERLARLETYINDIIAAEAGAHRAVERAREAGARDVEADALRVLGVVLRRRAEYAQAIVALTLSLNIHAELGDSLGIAKSRLELGVVRGLKGERTEGLRQLHGARLALDSKSATVETAETLRIRGFIHQNMAQLQEWQGVRRYPKANYHAALGLWKRVGDRQLEALTLNNLARLRHEGGDIDGAEVLLAQAKRIARDLGDRLLLAKLEITQSTMDHRMGRLKSAQARRIRALNIHRDLGDLEALWRDWAALSALHEALGDQSAAILYGKQAVELLGQIRRRAAASGSGAVAYYRDKRPIFERLARLLIEDDRLGEAQLVLDLLKAEEFYDFTGQRSGAEVGPSHPLSAEAERDAFSQLLEFARKLTDCEPLSEDKDCEASWRALIDAYDKQVDQIEATFEADFSREANREFGEKALDWATRLSAELETEAEPGTVVIHYVATAEKLFIIVTGAEFGSISRSVEVRDYELYDAAHAFRRALDDASREVTDEGEFDPLGEVIRPARRLYRWLIEPVQQLLDDETKRLRERSGSDDAKLSLLFHLDNALRYVPMAALHDGERWLAERFASSIFLAGAGSLSKPGDFPRTIAALGVSKAHGDFAALPGVAEELASLEDLFSTGEAAATQKFFGLDAKFNLASFRKAARGYNVLHIASHYRFGGGTNADSYLLLGTGETVSLRDISRMRFNPRMALVVLSACETALGAEMNGAEVEGLGVELLKRGVDNVVATLWKIDDRSAPVFMTEFYSNLVVSGVTRAKALQRAQIVFIEAGTVGNHVDKRFADPRHWAPVILMGNTQ